jgi:hypothetical protein
MEANTKIDKGFLESLVSLEHSRREIGRSTALMRIVQDNDNAIFVTSTPSYAKTYGIANRQILSPSAFVRAVAGGKLKDKIVIVDHFVLTWKIAELLDNDLSKLLSESEVKCKYLQSKLDDATKELRSDKSLLDQANDDNAKLIAKNKDLDAKLSAASKQCEQDAKSYKALLNDLINAQAILQAELDQYSNMTFWQRLKFAFSKPSVIADIEHAKTK